MLLTALIVNKSHYLCVVAFVKQCLRTEENWPSWLSLFSVLVLFHCSFWIVHYQGLIYNVAFNMMVFFNLRPVSQLMYMLTIFYGIFANPCVLLLCVFI